MLVVVLQVLKLLYGRQGNNAAIIAWNGASAPRRHAIGHSAHAGALVLVATLIPVTVPVPRLVTFTRMQLGQRQQGGRAARLHRVPMPSAVTWLRIKSHILPTRGFAPAGRSRLLHRR